MRSRSKSTLVALAAMSLLAACGGGESTREPRARSAGASKSGGAAPGASGAYSVVPVRGGGDVSGTVTFAGSPPSPETIEVSKDTSVCGETKTLHNVTVGSGGGLADAVVWIDGITQGKDWGSVGGGTVDQNKCDYAPHTQIVKAGDEVEIVNSDPILHNIHAYYRETETLFNLAQPMKGMKTPKKLDKSGPVHLKCDVHSWMSAWIFVAAHPYVAVTGPEGRFSLTDVPAGSWKVKAWHPKYGEKTMDVTVAAGGAAAAEFSIP